VLLCLGNGEDVSPYRWFTGLLQSRRDYPDVPTYNRFFRLKACEGHLSGRHVLVIGTPHPARWRAAHRQSEAAVAEARRLLQTGAG
jgi:hypothetical protein